MPVSRAVYVIIAFTTLLSWTVMFTELFRVTKSVWPCVILHTVEDSLINMLILSGYIGIAAGKEILVSPINGVIASALYLTVGLGIRAYRMKSNKKRSDESAAEVKQVSGSAIMGNHGKGFTGKVFG